MMRKRHAIETHTYMFVLAIVLVPAGLVYYYSIYSSENFVEMKIDSISYSGNNAIILLRSECYTFIVHVSKPQAETIELMMTNPPAERKSSIEDRMGFSPATMRIIEASGPDFYGEIITKNSFSYNIRTSPGDALAIAIETNSSIYMSKKMAGYIC